MQLPDSLVVVQGLESRWHSTWLQGLEWQCLLEQILLEEEQGEQEGEEYEEQGEQEGHEDQDQDSDEDLLRHFSRFSSFPSESPDSAYGSLSLSDLLPDSLESQPHSPGEESLSEQGSDSGVSDLSASFRELTPEPRLVQRHKAQTRARHRRQQAGRDTVTTDSRVAVKPARRVLCVPVCLAVLGLLLVLWLCDHVRCCDSVCALTVSPILQYTNGPPPL